MTSSEEFLMRTGWSKHRPTSGQFVAVWPHDGELWCRVLKWEDSEIGTGLMEYNPAHEYGGFEDEWIDVTNDTYPDALYLQLSRLKSN